MNGIRKCYLCVAALYGKEGLQDMWSGVDGLME